LEGVSNSKFPSVERIGKVPLKKKMFEKHEYFDVSNPDGFCVEVSMNFFG
jgi:hypothetical protein